MTSLDIRIAKSLQRFTGGATPFWKFFARFGMYGFVVALFAFAAVTKVAAVVSLFFPGLVAFITTSIVQYVVRRERPTATRTNFHQWFLRYSFPSAHAAASFTFAGVLSVAALAIVPSVALVFIPAAYILALGIAISRVVVGVHYPSDVLAGALLGSAIAVLWVTL